MDGKLPLPPRSIPEIHPVFESKGFPEATLSNAEQLGDS